MKDILYLAGYDLSPKKITGFEESIQLLYSANRDGSLRGIWNSDADAFLFLKSYNDYSKSSWLFSKLLQIIFALQLQHLFFKQKKWFYTLNDKPLFDCKRHWALFTGTKALNSKAILYTKEAFYTIACAENTTQLTANEDEILKEITRPSRGFIAPLLSMVNNSINTLSSVSMFIFNSNYMNSKSCKKIVQLAVFAFLVFTSNHSFAHVTATDGVVDAIDLDDNDGMLHAIASPFFFYAMHEVSKPIAPTANATKTTVNRGVSLTNSNKFIIELNTASYYYYLFYGVIVSSVLNKIVATHYLIPTTILSTK
jgi:hypothetical protein